MQTSDFYLEQQLNLQAKEKITRALGQKQMDSKLSFFAIFFKSISSIYLKEIKLKKKSYT